MSHRVKLFQNALRPRNRIYFRKSRNASSKTERIETDSTLSTKLASIVVVGAITVGVGKLISIFYNEQYGNGLSAAHQMAKKITTRSDDLG